VHKLNARLTPAVTILGLAAMLLAGCSASGATPSSPSTAGNGTLTVATGEGSLPQLDPGMASLQWERVLYPLLWDGLTAVNQQAKVVPALAKSWKHSADYKTWTFTLRPGVKFTNGRTLSAADIVWNADRAISKTNSSPAHQVMGAVSGVAAVGAAEVRFSLSSPNSALPLALTSLRVIAPESLKKINTEPVGTGPFQVKKFVPNGELDMVRNPHYWGKTPRLGAIQVISANDATSAVTALRTGSIQALWNIPLSDAKNLKADKSVRLVQSKGSTQIHYLALDNTSPPFNNVKARQALSYALDRNATKQVAYSGFGEASLTNNLLSTNSWAFSRKNQVKYTSNLQKAKQLFSESGVNSGDTLTWWGIAGAYPEWTTEAQLLEQNLSKIGIHLKIQNNEIGTWVNKFVPLGKKYPGVIVPNAGGDLDDPGYIFQRAITGGNEMAYSSAEMDQLSQQGLAVSSEAARQQVYEKMQVIYNRDVPAIQVVHYPLVTGVASSVSGVWEEPSGDLHLESASIGTK
jgi:peptide/nickel transport system substrate-binding protein